MDPRGGCGGGGWMVKKKKKTVLYDCKNKIVILPL